ncbi:MAG: hypothetical protein IJ057_06030 [Bacteroidales bacterium]|nr:hypothetical protein [Bacteroidales bacterium]
MGRKATKQQLDTIYKSMGENISSMYPSLLSVLELYRVLGSIDEQSEGKRFWMDLLRVDYFVLFCHLDIVTAIRAEQRAETVWEKRIHLKYLNVIQTEIFKAMFGFGKAKHCLWKKFCNNGINIDEKDRTEIDALVADYSGTFLHTDSKDRRDFAIHYDFDPIKVYDFLCRLSEEEEMKQVSKFLEICHRLLELVYKISSEMHLPLGMPQIQDYSLWERLNFFPDKDNQLLLKTKSSLNSYCKTLDSIANSYRLPEIVGKKFGAENIISHVQPIRESIHPGMLLLFIYIDICCAVIAYFSSEHYIEKQLNLRHLNVIVYEGMKKMYGFKNSNTKGNNNNEKAQSAFWKDFLYPIIIGEGNDDWRNRALVIEKQLETLAYDSSINDEDLRNMSVHIREKNDSDYIPRFTDKLIKMNPLVEMNKALKFLKILPDVMRLDQEVANIRYTDIKRVQDQRNREMINKLENIRNIVLQSCRDEEVKESLNQSTEKLISLLKM